MKRFETVDEFIAADTKWQAELALLRKTLVSCRLDESIKWGIPCYSFSGKNVVGIGSFKSYFGLWFHQGALLSDESGVLMNAQEGITKALRQWRFHSKREIKPSLIKQYVREAIALVEAGKQIKPTRKSTKITVPPELKQAFANNKRAKSCFDQMSPSCQREYANYVAEAKREETKLRRIEKILPLIIDRQGLNDKYR